MKPNIIDKPAMTLVGVVGCGSSVKDLDISGLWKRFTEHEHEIKHKIEDFGYELHIEEERQPPMHFCLVGIEVTELADLPLELFCKIIPPCKYAHFIHHFIDGDYGDAFKAAYDWLKDSEYIPAYAFDIQAYGEQFKGSDDPESVLEIFIPIKPKLS
jgi:AraC family transcriptional regulator